VNVRLLITNITLKEEKKMSSKSKRGLLIVPLYLAILSLFVVSASEVKSGECTPCEKKIREYKEAIIEAKEDNDSQGVKALLEEAIEEGCDKCKGWRELEKLAG
jgi:hypothetical protein